MSTALSFDTLQNFLDPALTNDGKPFAPVRYKEIAQERYLITKFCNTSYTDSGSMNPKEREYLLEFILNDLKRENEAKNKAFGNKGV